MKMTMAIPSFFLFVLLGLTSIVVQTAPVPETAVGLVGEARSFNGTDVDIQARNPVGVAMLVADIASSIGGAIVNQINQDKLDRSEFTQQVVKQLHEQDPSKNYVIVHTKHEAKWEGEKGKDWDHAHQEFDIKLGGTIGYEIYAAHKGNFKLLGDGGYLNWAFYGNADKVNAKEYNFN